MNSVSKTPISTSTKITLGIFLAFGAVRLADFIFFGHALPNLIAAVGFFLMSYGTFKNGDGKVPLHRLGKYVSVVGATIVLASFAVRYWA